MEKTVGILGGMGPMASCTYYEIITKHTKAEKDQDHIRSIILSDTGMPDRTGAILKGEHDEVRSRMLADCKQLEANGCVCIGVCCNTAHFFIDMIKDEVGIPIIHMIRETAKEIANSNPGSKIGILATDGTIKTELYQKALKEEGLQPVVPDTDIQKAVMSEIYDRVKAGLPADMKMWNEIEESMKAKGCEKLILACTELSVIKRDESLGELYVDPMEVLAKRMIEFVGKEYI